MRLSSMVSIMAGCLAYTSFACAIPIGVELDILPIAPRLVDNAKPNAKPIPHNNHQFTFLKKPVEPQVATEITKHQSSLSSSPPRSIVYILYPRVEDVRQMLADGSQPYACPAQQNEYKTAVINLVNEAKTQLELIGDPPQYEFLNPTECICIPGRQAVVFGFLVGGRAGGGMCRVGRYNSYCEAYATRSAEGVVEATILAPPNGAVVFSRP